MQDFPPVGSLRRRAALGFWVLFTAAAAVALVDGLYRWLSGGALSPLLWAFIAAGNLIGVWRWILPRLRARDADRH